MKRLLISMLLIAALGAGTAVAQDPFEDFDAFTRSFEDFGAELAGALPHNTTIGQQWADAHIGQLLGVPPRFGLGVSTGFTTVPIDSFRKAMENFDGISADDIVGELPSALQNAGLPLPGYTIDARVGGIGLPFDVGLKIGFLNDSSFGNLELNYLLVGGDVRYRVLREGILLPKVSVGLGVNHSRMRLGVPDIFGAAVEIDDVPDDPDNLNSTADLRFTDPDLFLQWETTVFDLTAQASKRFLIFQPFAGAGISYSRSNVGGGVLSELEITRTDAGATREDIQAALEALGEGDFNLTDNEFGFLATQDGVFNTRIFGGLGLRVFMMNLDLGASYELASGSFGAQIGTRIQF